MDDRPRMGVGVIILPGINLKVRLAGEDEVEEKEKPPVRFESPPKQRSVPESPKRSLSAQGERFDDNQRLTLPPRSFTDATGFTNATQGNTLKERMTRATDVWKRGLTSQFERRKKYG